MKGPLADRIRRIATVVIALAFLAPLVLMVVSSFRSNPELLSDPLGMPSRLDAAAYTRAFEVGDLGTRVRNSLIVTVVGVGLSVVLGAGAGYVAARLPSPFARKLLLGLFLIGLAVPPQTGIIPLFHFMIQLNLLGTLWPIIIANVVFALPLSVLIFAVFFEALPRDIEEAAAIDGASQFTTLWRIVLPISAPAAATAMVLATVTIWNDYFFGLVFAINPGLQTLPVGLGSFSQEFVTDWSGMMAYSAIIAVPVIIGFLLVQRYVEAGITTGAVK